MTASYVHVAFREIEMPDTPETTASTCSTAATHVKPAPCYITPIVTNRSSAICSSPNGPVTSSGCGPPYVSWSSSIFSRSWPAIGLLVNDRLIGIALIAPPLRRLGITESWAWRMRMLLGTGFKCTRRYLDYQQAVLACVPSAALHVLPLLGIHPQFQGQHYGEQLLTAVHNWCAEDEHSQGVILDTGNPRYLEFYKRQGYEEIGEIAVGPILEHVFYHAHPQTLQTAMA